MFCVDDAPEGLNEDMVVAPIAVPPLNVVEILLVYGVGAALWAGVTLAVYQMTFVRLARAREALRREQESNLLHYRAYMSDLNAIAEEMRQHGIQLTTVPKPTAKES